VALYPMRARGNFNLGICEEMLFPVGRGIETTPATFPVRPAPRRVSQSVAHLPNFGSSLAGTVKDKRRVSTLGLHQNRNTRLIAGSIDGGAMHLAQIGEEFEFFGWIADGAA